MPSRPATPRGLVDRLDAHRVALDGLLRSLPAEAVRQRPAPRAWSLAQLADHLRRIDAGLRLDGPHLRALARATSPARAGLLCRVLGLPVRIPAPPGVTHILPDDAPDLEAVLAARARAHAAWRHALGQMEPADLHRRAFRHPLPGPLAVADALAFLLAHHRHHDAQVGRILAAVAPGAARPEALR